MFLCSKLSIYLFGKNPLPIPGTRFFPDISPNQNLIRDLNQGGNNKYSWKYTTRHKFGRITKTPENRILCSIILIQVILTYIPT